MLDFLSATPRFVYVPVRLRRHELISLISAAGFELQADSHALWITADSEPLDIFASPGERVRIGTHRRVLISVDHPATVIVSGESARATRFTVIRADGRRESLYPQADPNEARRSLVGHSQLHAAETAQSRFQAVHQQVLRSTHP